MKYQFKFKENEYFYGGTSLDGTLCPLTKKSYLKRNFKCDCPIQTMPLFLSTKGRYIWSDNPFEVEVKDGVFYFDGEDVKIYEAGKTLKDAYIEASKKHFPPDKKKLPDVFFKTAQYNTWMEFTYNPTQEKVLSYAKNIIKNGFKPGILIIDEGWHKRYGNWEFDFYKFPDPEKMIKELHEMGFIVMLWVVPCVCPDGQDFITNTSEDLMFDKKKEKLFIRNKKGEVALFKWWNGYSALLDMTNESDRNFLNKKLTYLTEKYKVDGFKFDGGSVDMYDEKNAVNGPLYPGYNAHKLNISWNDFGRQYKYHEYKDTYMGGGKNTIERMLDRGHRWDKDGINTLIPSSVLQGLLGSPFICPDMIGGGEWSFNIMPGFTVDEELFVRMAEVSALCPMMQFSWAPWKALSPKNLKIVKNMGDLHEELSDYIISLVRSAEITGEPILRCLIYNDPLCDKPFINDEFMLGEDILVAPVITKNTFNRDVYFPQGKWQDSDNNIYEGRKTYNLASPLDKLLWFKKIK